MSYQVIARKWRPQSFTQLIGQTHISQTITNALKADRLPHALLFTGPRGTGKTSSARILAKALRCPNAKDFIPCNTCPECETIAGGRSVDVIEIDGASNNGVDAIRELRDTVGYMPSSGRYKVYIIDEVHMLSGSAFNALLKTLEEPPPHVIFVMATTEAQKIPNTILSRCQRFDFRRIPARLIADHLKEICEQEKVKFEPEALWVVARQGDGSMRDSQSLLEQVISFTEGQLTVAKVTEVLGLTDRLMLIDTLKALIARDTTALVGVIEKLFASGYDPVVFTQDLLEELRNLLLIKVVAKGVSSAIDLSDEEIDHLQKISADLGEEDIHLLFDMALKGAQDLLRSQDARVILEMLLLRMSAAPRLRDLRQITMGGSAANASSKKAAPRQTTGAAMAAPAQASSELSGDAQTWVDLVERVKAVNPLIGAKLEHLQMVSVSADLVKVSIPEKYKFLAGQIDDPQVVKKLKNYMKTFWGKAPEVEFVHTSGADSTAVSAKEIAENKQKNKKEQIQHQVENHPLVRSMKDLFNTEITSIKEKP